MPEPINLTPPPEIGPPVPEKEYEMGVCALAVFHWLGVNKNTASIVGITNEYFILLAGISDLAFPTELVYSQPHPFVPPCLFVLAGWMV